VSLGELISKSLYALRVFGTLDGFRFHWCVNKLEIWSRKHLRLFSGKGE